MRPITSALAGLAALTLSAPSPAQTITSFEADDWTDAISAGNVQVERVREHASDGDWALRVDFPGNEADTWPGITWQADRETTGHQALEFDVFNPGDDPVGLSWRIDLETGDPVFGGVTIQPGGPHAIEIWLVGLSDVTKVFPYIRMPRVDRTLYFDHFRWLQLDTDYFTALRYVDDATLPSPTPAELEHGYIVFARALTDVVFENSVPREHERIETVDLFATPGEYEPATLALRALEDLDDLRVSFDGVPATGEVLPIRTLDKRVVYSSREFVARMPVLCERRDVVDIAEATCKRFLIDLKIDEGADPGIHQGSVHIDREGGERVTLPLRLRVLPFTLVEPEGMMWGEYYRGPMLASDDETWSEYLRPDMVDMREHGMTSVGLCFGAEIENVEFAADGTCALNFPGDSRYEQFMNLYVELGYPAPVILLSDSGQSAAGMGEVPVASDEWANRYKGFWRAMQAEAKRRGWPEVIVQPVDEPGWQGQEEKERNIRCLELLKQIPGMRTEQDGPGDAYFHNEAGPHSDVWNYNGGLSADHYPKALDDGRMVLIYNCDVESYRPEADRYVNGWFQAAHATHGAFNWAYMSWNGSPYDDQDHKTGTWMHVYPSMDDEPGGPSMGWIGAREGIDDYRYISTLASLTGGQVIDRTLASLDVSPGVRGRARWTETGLSPDGAKTIGGTMKLPNGWTHDDYQKNRWNIARATIDALAARGTISPVGRPSVSKRKSGELLTDLRWETRAQHARGTAPIAAARQVTIPVWDRSPEIDGEIGSGIWRSAARLEPFTVNTGKGKPKMRTDVLIGTDGAELYIAATCHEDNMAHITATVTQDGGQVWQDDCVEIFVDSNLDRSTFKQIIVNSLGTQGWSGTMDSGWRSNSRVKAAHHEDSWTVEMAIPMAELGITGGQFGLNVCRERRPMETLELSCWSPTGGAFGQPSMFGIASIGQAWLKVPPALLGENPISVTMTNETDAARSVSLTLEEDGRRRVLENALALAPGETVTRAYTYEASADATREYAVWMLDAGSAETLAQRRFAVDLPPPVALGVRPNMYYVADAEGFVEIDLNVAQGLLTDSALVVELLRGRKRVGSTAVSQIEGNRLRARLDLGGMPEGDYSVRARLSVPGEGKLEATAPLTRMRGPFD